MTTWSIKLIKRSRYSVVSTYNTSVFARLLTCMSRIPRPRRLNRCAPETRRAFSLRTYNQTKRTTCSFENDASIHSSFAVEFFYICWPNSILFLLSRFTITLTIWMCFDDAYYVDFLIDRISSTFGAIPIKSNLSLSSN